MSWLIDSPLTKLFQLKNNLFATTRTTSQQQQQPLDSCDCDGRKRTLDDSKSDRDKEEPASKIPRVQVQALLTDEILDHILRFVSIGDLKRCRHVNRHWNSVATTRWKKRGVVLRVGEHWGSMMDFVNFSRTAAATSSEKTSLTPPGPPRLLDKISALTTDGSVVENPATISAFVALCQPHLKILNLIMYLGPFVKDNQARINSIKQLLTTFLTNLEHLVLDFDNYFADILFDPNHKLQQSCSSSAKPTKLRRLEILRYMCHEEQASLEQGLLAELIAQSHNLEDLAFEQSKRAWIANIPPCGCYKMLFKLLNSARGGGQLTKVKQLRLTFKVIHKDNCRFCVAAVNVNNGEAAEEESGPLLQNSQLQALSFSRIPWKEMLSTLLYHQQTLKRLEIGVHVLSPPDNDGRGGAEPDPAVNLPNLWEFKADVQLSYPFFTTLLTLYPQLGSLALTNPTAEQLQFMWKHFIQLHTLELHFVGKTQDSCSVQDFFSTTSTVQDPQFPQAEKIMHLDSLLSGFSINTCELIYTKIAADQTILSNSLSQPRPLLASNNTIRNLTKLRRLEISRASESSDELYPIRLTEVGLVLVLLKLSSLTHLTLNSCTMLLPGTMPLLEQNVSPAMIISISEQAEYKIADLRQAKAEWL